MEDPLVIEDVFESNKICRLAFSVDGRPYVFPINYGYEKQGPNRFLYFHTGHEGKKIDMMKQNPRVCVEIDDEFSLKFSETACSYTANYRSIIAYGQLVEVLEKTNKIRGLNALMYQLTGKNNWDYEEKILKKTNVLRLDIESFTCRVSKD